jgi:hypothetical protein
MIKLFKHTTAAPLNSFHREGEGRMGVCPAHGESAFGIIVRDGSSRLSGAIWIIAHCYSPRLKVCDELRVRFFWKLDI